MRGVVCLIFDVCMHVLENADGMDFTGIATGGINAAAWHEHQATRLMVGLQTGVV